MNLSCLCLTCVLPDAAISTLDNPNNGGKVLPKTAKVYHADINEVHLHVTCV